MDPNPWRPRTLEDRLLEQYRAEHPGELFLELNVGRGDGSHGPRRLDGVLIPGSEPRVHPQDSYTLAEVEAAIRGATVHLLEAKRTLNRNVIGQVEVGVALLERDFDPGSIVPVAVCGDGNEDLQWYCDRKGIRTVIYPVRPPGSGDDPAAPGRRDVRSAPDPARRRAFMTGWAAAVDGQLYGTVTSRKTHMNMGNLFGWIYGDQPEGFRLETWERYVGSQDDWRD